MIIKILSVSRDHLLSKINFDQYLRNFDLSSSNEKKKISTDHLSRPIECFLSGRYEASCLNKFAI